MNTLEILTKTKEILSPRGKWIKGVYTKNEGCHCLLGGITAATGDHDHGYVGHQQVNRAEREHFEAFERVLDAIYDLDKHSTVVGDASRADLGSFAIADWNDMRSRTKGQVLAVLDHAIAASKAAA